MGDAFVVVVVVVVVCKSGSEMIYRSSEEQVEVNTIRQFISDSELIHSLSILNCLIFINNKCEKDLVIWLIYSFVTAITNI